MATHSPDNAETFAARAAVWLHELQQKHQAGELEDATREQVSRWLPEWETTATAIKF